jgi:tetratricopeptide (TPR) repeat protein
VEEEARDALYVSLAVALSKGDLDLNAIQMRLDDADLKHSMQAEDVKMQLRSSFLTSLMFPDDSGVSNAIVAREIALRCQNREIFYGMELGSADAVAAADYVVAILFLRKGSTQHAVHFLAELAHIAAEDDDVKGAIEALAGIGAIDFNLESYSDAAKYYKKAIEAVAQLPSDDDLAITFSTQDMVRNDNKNVFDFDSDRFLPATYDTSLLLCFLEERLASCLLQSRRTSEALQASSHAIQLWREHPQTDEPSIGIQVMITHTLLLAAQGNISAARAAALELQSLELDLALPPDLRKSAVLLTMLN